MSRKRKGTVLDEATPDGYEQFKNLLLSPRRMGHHELMDCIGVPGLCRIVTDYTNSRVIRCQNSYDWSYIMAYHAHDECELFLWDGQDYVSLVQFGKTISKTTFSTTTQDVVFLSFSFGRDELRVRTIDDEELKIEIPLGPRTAAAYLLELKMWTHRNPWDTRFLAPRTKERIPERQDDDPPLPDQMECMNKSQIVPAAQSDNKKWIVCRSQKTGDTGTQTTHDVYHWNGEEYCVLGSTWHDIVWDNGLREERGVESLTFRGHMLECTARRRRIRDWWINLYPISTFVQRFHAGYP